MPAKLLRSTTDASALIAEAASVCYDSDPKDITKLIKHCYDSGHHSVLEHVTFTWKVWGISRACLAQLTRHRFVSFSVQSQRYCGMNGAKFLVPPSIAKDEEATKVYFDVLEHIREGYDKLTMMGIPNEDARFLLPNATETVLICTMNLREFIHVCNERLCTMAQWEIRELVEAMVAEVNAETGNEFAYMLVPKCEVRAELPMCPESKKRSCGKHRTVTEIAEALK